MTPDPVVLVKELVVHLTGALSRAEQHIHLLQAAMKTHGHLNGEVVIPVKSEVPYGSGELLGHNDRRDLRFSHGQE